LKVAFDVQPLLDHEKTGVGYSADGFIQNLVQRHPETSFAFNFFSSGKLPEDQEKIKKYLLANVELHGCRYFSGKAYRFLSSLLPLPYQFFFHAPADITHFFNFIIPPLVKGKKIVTIHDMVIRRFPETMRAKTKYMLYLNLDKTIRRADRIITDSEFSKQEILTYYRYPADNIKVVHIGVDTTAYHDGISREEIQRARSLYHIEGDYLLYLGMLEPRKNIERLLEAYGMARKKHGGFPILVIAGKKGWLFEQIFRRVEELGLGKSVIFTGYVSDSNKPALLAGARCFCFPSLYEGFGMPPLEAMACGTPVMVSRAASLPEIVGDAALIVNPYSVESMAEAIECLSFGTEPRESLRRKGLERVKQFNWADTAEALYQVYKEVVHEHGV
jgi:glycosyltransferase involved in cell wall biosynthesis